MSPSWDKQLSKVQCDPNTVDSFAEVCIDEIMAECESNADPTICDHDYRWVMDPGGFRCCRCGDVYVHPYLLRIFALREKD